MKITNMEAEVLLEALPDEDCRFDHNGDCQEHAWFGINGKCPVALGKELISTALKAPVETESAPRPVIDREALRAALDACTCQRLPGPGPQTLRPRPTCPYHGDTKARLDVVMELARPMPTEVEIAERVRQIYINGGAARTHAQEAASEIADAVMALLNGSES